jgi:uncharacterized protein (DUF305 family)
VQLPVHQAPSPHDCPTRNDCRVNYNPIDMRSQAEDRGGPNGIVRALALALATLLLGVGVGMYVQRERSQSTFEQTLDAPNQTDIGFLRDMMTHHEQAIELSLIVLTRGTDPSVRQEAVDILLAQRGEHVQMGDRLERWGVDVESEDGTVMGWMGMAMPAEQMPGLASTAEVDKLKTLSGTAADVEFLRLMINHHAGGVDMAKAASKAADVAFVVVLADRMAALQATEIAEMQLFARRLGADIAAPKPEHADHSAEATDTGHSGEGHS